MKIIVISASSQPFSILGGSAVRDISPSGGDTFYTSRLRQKRRQVLPNAAVQQSSETGTAP
jgi:hypothetical protein